LYFIFIGVHLIQQCFLVYKMPLIQDFQHIYVKFKAILLCMVLGRWYMVCLFQG